MDGRQTHAIAHIHINDAKVHQERHIFSSPLMPMAILMVHDLLYCLHFATIIHHHPTHQNNTISYDWAI
jgi:hypothetical protein